MSKLKFGGMSFGGKYPHVTIYGKTHKLKFGRSKKQKGYSYNVKKKTKRDFFLKYFYFLFPLYDLFIYFIFNPPKAIVDSTQGITDSINTAIPKMTGLYIPSWVYIVIMILYTFGVYYFVYLILFEGVRKWHGTEHKVISAAENEDLENVKSYNPIHERCGGTLFPTFMLGYVLFLIFYHVTGLPYGQMTFITILVFLNIRFFHKYDKFGIWFGKKFQKYVSVSEPDDWQLKLGKEGMKQLVNAEQNKEFKKVEKIFDNKDVPTKKRFTVKKSIITSFEVGLVLIILFGIFYAPAVPESSYITDKYIIFNGLPGETKTDYVLTQVNVTKDTLTIDRIRVWGIFNLNESNNFNKTIYENIDLYLSLNNNTKVFIKETETENDVKYWEITNTNYSFLPIKETTTVNFTFEFTLPEGDYNETYLFNYTPVLRFTSFV